MKTKSEILSECTGIDLPELEFKNEVQIIRPSEAIEAMDKCSKSVAMEFAEWKETNYYQISRTGQSKGKWFYSFRTIDNEYFTTSELYAKFEEERTAQ